ncbi:MAG: hypothetical protein JWR01_117, partial [Subtercola sp.]|nr:hypothetical protein [Subtercola sp.]
VVDAPAYAVRADKVGSATEFGEDVQHEARFATSVDPVVVRVRRLLHPESQLSLSARTGILCLAALLLALPVVLLFTA